MSNISLNKAGGTAFPVDRISMGDGSVSSGPGMSLRDYFAAKAMQGMLAHGTFRKEEDVARKSYEIADAMLKVRGEA